jgi:hypothetical protein
MHAALLVHGCGADVDAVALLVRVLDPANHDLTRQNPAD